MVDIPQEWLRKKGAAADFERAALEWKASAFNLPLEKVVQKFGSRPFGQSTDGWRKFIEKQQEGDELWFFNSPDEMFAKKLGCQGYAIVRNGKIHDTFVTLMS